MFGLLGPNGAGKTTAVRVLATNLRPDAGRVEVMGRDVVRQAAAVRFQIGLAGQSAAVDPNLTGRENLRLIGTLAQMHRRDVAPRAAELLERFDLSDAADRPVRTYSGGMRRRLDVAAALVQRPPVLYLDEPTTGLDIQSRTELWAVIRELVAEGSTVLLTTQYLEEADRLANRIAVVDHGHIVANDTSAGLRSHLADTVIEIGMETEEQARQAHELLTHVCSDHPRRDGTTIRLTAVNGPRSLIDALRTLDANSLSPATLKVHEATLDDAFLALTGRRPEGGDDASRAEGGEDSEGGSRAKRLPRQWRRRLHRHRRRRRTAKTSTPIAKPARRPAARRQRRPANGCAGGPHERHSDFPQVGLPAPTTSCVRRLPRRLGHRPAQSDRLPAVPTLVVFTLIQPVVFVLLFRYVFGGAIKVPGGVPYVDYLMPGIFVQTVAFGATNTAIGLATDVKSGMLERFHALPMTRSAVLAGRTGADLVRNVLVVILMAVVGYLVGFRVQTNALLFLAGILVVLMFAYAFSWIFATVGLAIGDPESAQAATFPVLAPLVFASSVFVPVSGMPSWLQGFATDQPVSVTANAARARMLGGPTLSWVLQSIALCAGIVLVCAPLAIRVYRRTSKTRASPGAAEVKRA